MVWSVQTQRSPCISSRSLVANIETNFQLYPQMWPYLLEDAISEDLQQHPMWRPFFIWLAGNSSSLGSGTRLLSIPKRSYEKSAGGKRKSRLQVARSSCSSLQSRTVTAPIGRPQAPASRIISKTFLTGLQIRISSEYENKRVRL